MVIYNKEGLSQGSFSFKLGSHGMLVQSFSQAAFLWSQGVKRASIFDGVERRQCIVRRAYTVDVSGSDRTDFDPSSHGASVRNRRSRVFLFRDESGPSEMVGNTISRVRLFWEDSHGSASWPPVIESCVGILVARIVDIKSPMSRKSIDSF